MAPTADTTRISPGGVVQEPEALVTRTGPGTLANIKRKYTFQTIPLFRLMALVLHSEMSVFEIS